MRKSQAKAVNRYIKKAYDRIALNVPKGQRDVIKAHAEKQGLSVNAYIRQLIYKDVTKN